MAASHGGRTKGVASKSGAAPKGKHSAPVKKVRAGTHRTHVSAHARAGTHRTRKGP